MIGYLRRRLNGEVIDFVELDMPTQTLDTMAVMCTITPEALQDNGIDPLRVPGSLHAAEHAAIGLLPLVASCDRGDIGGVSMAVGPEDGLPTIFVYDGYPGGAGFADRGFRQITTWWGATAAAIEACECPNGCPSCVQSPKCGNGNEPLDKAGAVRVLRLVLGELARTRCVTARWTTHPSTVVFHGSATGQTQASPSTQTMRRTAGQRDPFPVPDDRAHPRKYRVTSARATRIDAIVVADASRRTADTLRRSCGFRCALGRCRWPD